MDIETWSAVTEYITQLYEQLKSCTDGTCASYIPQLAKANPDWFAISLVTVDGKVFEIGDTHVFPSIQSCSKPLNYALSIREHGIERIMNLINVEPSGRSFNDSELDEKKRPFNSLINAGAILTSSMIKSDLSRAERFGYIVDQWKDVVGSDVGYDNEVFLSEEDSCDSNLSIVHKMMSVHSYPTEFTREQILKSFQLYLQCCSITINSTGLARFAAMLANSGIIAGTDKQFLDPDINQYVLSVMDSAGMYNYSGRWNFTIGIPAKSGVSGMIYAVIPRVCGITVFSPPLDEYGNSVKGVKFFTKFAKKFNVHKYNFLQVGLHIKTKTKKSIGMDIIYSLTCACADNDILQVDAILDSYPDIDLNIGDYDNRCPLHLAVEKGSSEIVYKLLRFGANPLKKDNTGNYPLKYAAVHKNIEYFYAFIAYFWLKLQKQKYFNSLKSLVSP